MGEEAARREPRPPIRVHPCVSAFAGDEVPLWRTKSSVVAYSPLFLLYSVRASVFSVSPWLPSLGCSPLGGPCSLCCLCVRPSSPFACFRVFRGRCISPSCRSCSSRPSSVLSLLHLFSVFSVSPWSVRSVSSVLCLLRPLPPRLPLRETLLLLFESVFIWSLVIR